jgi:hypothetical protein
VSAWVADHLTDAIMIGGGVVFYGGFFYRPLLVVWAVANALIGLVGIGAILVAIVTVLFRRGGCPCCGPGRDAKHLQVDGGVKPGV